MRQLTLILFIAAWIFIGCSGDTGEAGFTNADDPDAGAEDVDGDGDADGGDGDADAGNGGDGDGDGDTGLDADTGDPPQECTENADCDTDNDEYCERIGCDEPGTCKTIPDDVGCMEVETPYCDCSGETQISPNSCIWAPHDHEGACEDENGGDPVECFENSHCDEDADEYCDREPGCDPDEPGECRPLDELYGGGCEDMITTYCDCRGETQTSSDTCIEEPYDNLGECDDGDGDGDGDITPGPDECLENADCDEAADEYCDRPDGCQQPGTCEPIPDDAVCLMVLTDYCDCDGNTQTSPTSCIWEPKMHTGPCQQ